MRRGVKVAIWVAIFAACAAAGAFVASRSNPFPPGVPDPGARPSPTDSPTPQPQGFSLTMRSDSRHVLHVGGECRTDWNVSGSVVIEPNGAVSGEAIAELRGQAECSFPQAQVETKRIWLDVRGALSGKRLRLSFSETARTPEGSADLGGFVATLRLIDPSFRLVGSSSTATVLAERPDGDLGRFVSNNRAHITAQ